MNRWQDEIKSAVRSAEDVQKLLYLNEEETGKIAKILEEFPMSVTPYYLSLVNFEYERCVFPRWRKWT